jgi:hypothetical protein
MYAQPGFLQKSSNVMGGLRLFMCMSLLILAQGGPFINIGRARG